MILHLITDRRRLAPGVPEREAARCLAEQARAAVDAGIDVIQLRERDLAGGALLRLTEVLLEVTRQSRTKLVVNDRLDVALTSGADGVHLRGDSFDAAAARRCTPPGFIIGRSVRSVADLRAAGPVDYVVAGTVWPTPSKPPDHRLLGLDGLAEICAASAVPVLAIGGVEQPRAAQLASAGASGAAAVGMFMALPDTACRAIPLREITATLRQMFDTAIPRS